MPIPYHNDEELSSLGAAAFLVVKFASGNLSQCVGCVFLVNAIGEPLEFAYNRVEMITSELWNGADIQRGAVSRLVTSLFDAVCLTPKLLFILFDPPLAFSLNYLDPLKLDIPTVAVSKSADQLSTTTTVIWGPISPNAEESRLYELISSRCLLFEPFERAQEALRVVFAETEGLT